MIYLFFDILMSIYDLNIFTIMLFELVTTKQDLDFYFNAFST